MCPSYMVTLEEEHSTRGRANALRAVLDGRLSPQEWTSQRLYRVMELCISCKGCKAECPSNVDMARLKSEFLDLYHRAHRYSLRDRMVIEVDRVGRWGVATAPLSNWMIGQGWFRWVLEKVVGVDRRRSLPPYGRETLESWFHGRRGAGTSPGGGKKRVVLFNDTFMNYHEPEIGVAATRLLEAAGFEVVLARKNCCGRPAISKGKLAEARRLARFNLKNLYPYVADGCAIVGCEPSCLLTFRDEYPELVPGPEAEEVARHTYLLEEFFVTNGLKIEMTSSPREILTHGHCHQKALVGTEPLVSFLNQTGARVRVVDSGCCGMAGAFGYETEHYNLSNQMAERRLLPAVREAAADVVIVAPGTSCRHQIKDGTGRLAYHPAEVVARAAGLV